MHRQHPHYRPNVSAIMNIDDVNGRREHVEKGRLGDLLFDPNSSESVRRYMLASFDPNTDEPRMFDKKHGVWIPYDPWRVPKTYSMVPAPQDVVTELDLFIRSVPLVNHKYIWAPDTGKIPANIFGKLKSNTNQTMIGRFTIAPEMPSIDHLDKLARMTGGFIEQDQASFIRFV